MAIKFEFSARLRMANCVLIQEFEQLADAQTLQSPQNDWTASVLAEAVLLSLGALFAVHVVGGRPLALPPKEETLKFIHLSPSTLRAIAPLLNALAFYIEHAFLKEHKHCTRFIRFSSRTTLQVLWIWRRKLLQSFLLDIFIAFYFKIRHKSNKLKLNIHDSCYYGAIKIIIKGYSLNGHELNAVLINEIIATKWLTCNLIE